MAEPNTGRMWLSTLSRLSGLFVELQKKYGKSGNKGSNISPSVFKTLQILIGCGFNMRSYAIILQLDWKGLIHWQTEKRETQLSSALWLKKKKKVLLINFPGSAKQKLHWFQPCFSGFLLIIQRFLWLTSGQPGYESKMAALNKINPSRILKSR